MGYSVNEVSLEEARKSVSRFPYALLYKISAICFKESSGLTEEDWEECFEARIFGKDGEVHIFENGAKAVLVRENGETDHIDQSYEISSRFLSLGKQLVVRQYLKQDEDGQNCVSLTRLVDVR